MAATYDSLNAEEAKPKKFCTGPVQGCAIAGAIAIIVIVGVTCAVLIHPPPPLTGGPASPADVALSMLPNSRTFLGIGDWGRGGAYGQAQTGMTMANWAAALDAQSVHSVDIINVGDNFYDNGVASAADPQWQTSFTNVYNEAAFKTRKWYSIAGNRDYRGSLAAEIGWDGDGTGRWYYPSLFYYKTWSLPAPAASASAGVRGASSVSASSGCVSILFVDTTPYLPGYWSNPDTPQMLTNLQASNITAENAWLRSTLQQAAQDCGATLVVGHHPLYSGGHQGNTPQLISAWEPLLQQYADAYIAGHEHTLQHLRNGTVEYIGTGAGSQLNTGTTSIPQMQWFQDGVHGFTVHSVNATHVRHSFISAAGPLLHTVLRPLKRAV